MNLDILSSLFRSLGTLFWSLFDMADLEELKIPEGKLYLTEMTGLLLYAAFMVIAVIVMLNALIAMMSNTYTSVEVLKILKIVLS